jgi:hypothetical protein
MQGAKMLETDETGMIIEAATGKPVAIVIDDFVTALGIETQSDTVIFRLHHRDWPTDGPSVPQNQAFQFALPAHRAAQLGTALLELAAQAEKDAVGREH